MMRGPRLTAMAVRNPRGEIVLEKFPTSSGKRPWPWRVPVIRGIFNFADSMIFGYRCLMRSAEISGLEDAEEEMRREKAERRAAREAAKKGTPLAATGDSSAEAIPPADAAPEDTAPAAQPDAEAAPEQQFRDRLQAYAGHFWLMFDGETLISFVDGMVTDQPDLTDDLYENAALHSETGAWQMIFGVVTRPEYRKHGLAAQLLNRAIADTRQQGRKGLVLTCKDKLVHYYAKFGFVNEGVSQSTHGNVAWNQMRLTF